MKTATITSKIGKHIKKTQSVEMWWTDDGQAEKNSILRAISGGPIYVSDTLNRSRAEVLKPLIFDNGRILRGDNPAVPTKDCLTENPVSSGTISPKDIEGLYGEEFAVYEHFSKELKIMKAEECFELQLENINEYKLYVIVPLKDGCGVIGRTDKFISPATYSYNKSHKVEFVEDGPYAYVENYKLILEE